VSHPPEFDLIEANFAYGWRERALKAEAKLAKVVEVMNKAGEWIAAVEPKLPMPGVGDTQQEVLDLILSALAAAKGE
jgi:hypothetical protein